MIWIGAAENIGAGIVVEANARGTGQRRGYAFQEINGQSVIGSLLNWAIEGRDLNGLKYVVGCYRLILQLQCCESDGPLSAHID